MHHACSPLIASRDGVPPAPIVWARLRAWAAGAAKHFPAQRLAALGLSGVADDVRPI